MIIRQVEDKDLAQCYMVETLCFPPQLAASKDTIKRRIDWYPKGFLVAETDGAIIGMVNTGATDQDDVNDANFKHLLIGHNPNGKNLFIFGLAVVPKFQGKGVARYLLSALHERAVELNKKKLILHCMEPLVKYYEKLGFVNAGVAERSAAERSAAGDVWYVMSKQVDPAEVQANVL